MKKIVIITNRKASEIGWLDLLAALFPECEVEIRPPGASPHPIPGRREGMRVREH